MSNYITVKFTSDQVRFLEQLINDHVIYNGVRQSPARRGVAIRTINALGNNYSEVVDHSASERIINAKLASGELKLPKI
jgi:predicted xylose isomerase-like sugar epimerase